MLFFLLFSFLVNADVVEQKQSFSKSSVELLISSENLEVKSNDLLALKIKVNNKNEKPIFINHCSCSGYEAISTNLKCVNKIIPTCFKNICLPLKIEANSFLETVINFNVKTCKMNNLEVILTLSLSTEEHLFRHNKNLREVHSNSLIFKRK